MQISKHETIVVTYLFEGVKSYIITRNILNKYTLYKIIEDDYKKLKTADNPLTFEEIIEKDRSE